MAEGSNGNGGDNNGVGKLKDAGATMGSRIDDQTTEKASSTTGVHGSGNEQGCGTEVGVDSDWRVPVGSEAMGPQIPPLDPSLAVEGTVITGRGFGGGSGSDSGGRDVTRDRPPPRDSDRGNGLATEADTSGEVPSEQVEFRQVADSSGHRPITRGDFAEFFNEAVLDRLLRDNLAIVEAVLTTLKERKRAIELAQEEEWLRGEAKRAGADE